MTPEFKERCDRLDQMIQEGRLLRNSWKSTDELGREHACLIVALSPEVADAIDNYRAHPPAACPAWLMPTWLADCVPSIDDNGTEQEWEATVRRFASLARRWWVLGPDDWEIARRHAISALMGMTTVFLGDGHEQLVLDSMKFVLDPSLPNPIETPVWMDDRWNCEDLEYAVHGMCSYACCGDTRSNVSMVAAYTVDVMRLYEGDPDDDGDMAQECWDRAIDMILTAIEQAVSRKESES